MSVSIQRLDSGVGVIRLDRPERRNAMDTAMLDRLIAEIERFRDDPELGALVFSTTSTTALSVGADMGEDLTAEQGRRRMALFGTLYAEIEAFPVPTVAVMVGNVVGAGAELAAGCDLRIAGDNLKLAWVGPRHGIPVGVARLVPLVGSAAAKELIYTGRTLRADDALALNLASRLVRADDAEQAGIGLATEIASHPNAGLRTIKQLFRDLEGSANRVHHENAVLERFQREGPGLPQRRA